ncbi:hypothetical protein CH306_17635 [Rhodococcus sp. 15-725-2-2b]|uniref:hypothetical protein n=1 Tax=unclassified Rhodococcus (in: high G+C Gram-positive bacteria) TaxID=192944 RepID=UPI000B9ACFE5|nr:MULTISPECIES: hypothetical protein [unclassified Rhodococcus (in: high G+C Gram-positive bacteria)]OZC61996.1 hypothetical protein CH276_15420 [Rhodococcus sp. 06-470-2]OZC64506.1 hypothetical protein CH277_17540 [Rhodococcus sp. 06-469-3-2]OZD51139.1 hypothetical protein CH264_02175 [Rhodococcus sp. 06-1477-1A]OZE58126.1 hypothetical protein CH265_23010 [Rhodococcus sp. 05-2221-1B]OZE71578.1 hypothetical protein CH306_17635 [Rhodococcus sp. 15-725-2-2b]
MAIDYRNVGAEPPSSPNTGTVSGDQHSDSKPAPKRWIIPGAVALAILAVVSVIVVGLSGSSDNSGGGGSDAIRAVHGPTTVNNGVPSGYTRDTQGASTAAVNVLQAFDQGSQGRIDMNDVRSTMIAADPGAELAREIELGSNRDESSDVMNTLPAAVHVSSFSTDAAQISVWSMTTTQSDINNTGTVAVSTLWATTDISLVWQDGDWKAKDWSYRQGPRPEDASYPAADSALGGQLTAGYYTFYID